MAEIIRVPNFSEINLQELTTLDADATVGQNQITLLNPTIYSSSDILLIGGVGSETGEVCQIQSITGKVVTLTTNLINKHNRFESVYRLFGDKVRLYSAPNVDGTTPADGSFSLVTSVTIQGDDIVTDVTDPVGGSSYWYKTTYYNSLSSAETSLAMSIAVRGGGYGHMASIESIRIETALTDNQLIDDSRFAERRDQAEAEVLAGLAAAGYAIPLQATGGTPYTPPLIENIVRLLAAGYMLQQEYGPVAEGDTKSGDVKIKRAKSLIADIQGQKMVLLDALGQPLTRTAQVSGWPDSSTEFVGTDGETGEPFQMRMSKVF